MHPSDPGINPTAARGCGNSRKAGGVYIECSVSTTGNGTPLSHYITDPPIPYTAPSTQGMTIIEGPDGTKHLIDHVGAQHYPYASDYIEEGRKHGFSRRIPKNLDLSGLTAESRIITVHPRGRIANHQELQKHLEDPARLNLRCSHYLNTGDDNHLHPKQDCNRHQYVMNTDSVTGDQRILTPATRYSVAVLPDGVQPEYESAIIAQIPITGISVISTQDGSHTETLERFRNMHLAAPVNEAPE